MGVFFIPKYNRVVIKISGEALAGDKGFGLDSVTIDAICDQLKACVDLGVQIAIVVGAGNFWRGRFGKHMDKTRADYMGMLATVINALALQDAMEQRGVVTRVQTAIEMRAIAEPYIRGKAMSHLSRGRVVVFACGTGNPYFTTDTAAVLRALEINADVILLAKNVDGVYDSDPNINKDAVKFDKMEYLDILNRRLGIMDATATSLSMDHEKPILLFGLDDPENITKIIKGEHLGTIVKTNRRNEDEGHV